METMENNKKITVSFSLDMGFVRASMDLKSFTYPQEISNEGPTAHHALLALRDRMMADVERLRAVSLEAPYDLSIAANNRLTVMKEALEVLGHDGDASKQNSSAPEIDDERRDRFTERFGKIN
jgi:hypothetical protein